MSRLRDKPRQLHLVDVRKITFVLFHLRNGRRSENLAQFLAGITAAVFVPSGHPAIPCAQVQTFGISLSSPLRCMRSGPERAKEWVRNRSAPATCSSVAPDTVCCSTFAVRS